MSRDTRGGRVIVVARDRMQAARVESAIRELTGWRIDVGSPRQLQELLAEHPDAVVVLALAEAEIRRLLRAMGAWPRSPASIAVCADPASLWTSGARALGLRAALPLHATEAMLASAVRAVHAGLVVLHAETLMSPRAAGVPSLRETALTAREREILDLMAEGANNRAIAARLAISRHTAKFHVASILAKLGARSRTEAVALALRRGLVAV
jgi:DNA-binding NarL/FixJ family response regulator